MPLCGFLPKYCSVQEQVVRELKCVWLRVSTHMPSCSDVCVFPVHINLTNTNCAHPMKGQKPTPDICDVYIEFLVK